MPFPEKTIAGHNLVIPFFIGLVTFCLHLPGFWWGQPGGHHPDQTHSWGVDEEIPLGPLADVYNIVHPQKIQNLGYPWMHSFMIMGVYAPYLGVLWVKGDLSTPSPEFPYGLKNPEKALGVLTGLAHLLSVLLFSFTVVFCFLTGKWLWNQRAGLFAACFAGLLYPMFYYSKTGNKEAPMLFFMAMGIAAFSRILSKGITAGNIGSLGVATGFAVAVKEQSAALFLFFPIIVLVTGIQQAKKETSPAIFKWVVIFGFGALACFMAFGLGSGWFVAPQRFYAHLEFISGRMNEIQAGQIQFLSEYPKTLNGHFNLLNDMYGHWVDSLTLPGFFFCLISGLILIVKRSKSALIWFAPLGYFLVLFFSAHTTQLRYQLPIVFCLCIMGGWGLSKTVEKIFRPNKPIPSAVWAIPFVIAIFSLILNLLNGFQLTYFMINDSRYKASSVLSNSLNPGSHIAYFGPSQKIPPLPPGVSPERAAPYLGASHSYHFNKNLTDSILSHWKANPPAAILLIPDHSSHKNKPFSSSMPDEIYQALMNNQTSYSLWKTIKTKPIFPFVNIPNLDYPTVNPPIRIFIPNHSY